MALCHWDMVETLIRTLRPSMDHWKHTLGRFWNLSVYLPRSIFPIPFLPFILSLHPPYNSSLYIYHIYMIYHIYINTYTHIHTHICIYTYTIYILYLYPSLFFTWEWLNFLHYILLLSSTTLSQFPGIGAHLSWTEASKHVNQDKGFLTWFCKLFKWWSSDWQALLVTTCAVFIESFNHQSLHSPNQPHLATIAIILTDSRNPLNFFCGRYPRASSCPPGLGCSHPSSMKFCWKCGSFGIHTKNILN